MNSDTDGVDGVTLAVITYDRRDGTFARFLGEVCPAIDAYAGDVELLVVNNGGAHLRAALEALLGRCGFSTGSAGNPPPGARPARVVDSVANDIASARNTALECARLPLLAFLDDDERPEPDWLVNLERCLRSCGTDIVAGPVHPLYEGRVPRWLKRTDLHNTRGRSTGTRLDFIGAGNCLMHRLRIGDMRFDPSFGVSGGEDTEMFLRLSRAGLTISWCREAVVWEYIPSVRSSTPYALSRFMAQGQIYRRVMRSQGRTHPEWLFSLRAAAMFAAALPVALVLILLKRDTGGDWLKRAFSNAGKLVRTRSALYE